MEGEGSPQSTKDIFVQKSPQELAAQAIKVWSINFNEQQIPNAEKLKEQSIAWRKEIEDLLDKRVDDKALAKELDRIYAEARRMGIWKATEAEDKDARLEMATNLFESYGNSREVAEEYVRGSLKKQGYVAELRMQRRWDERDFNEKLGKFLEARPLEPTEESERIKSLENRTIYLRNLSEDDIARLKAEFIGGNFVYHGARTAEILKILGDGELLNFKAVWEREEKRAKEEGRERETLMRNSGYEGISWSLNQINALPGDRYHIAGFLGSPARVLQESQQFAVPSRPAPFELLQINGEINVYKFYTLKTQEELFHNIGLLGENNSVLDNLVKVQLEYKRLQEEKATGKEVKTFFDEPMLLKLIREHSDTEIVEMVKGKYSLQPDGTIQFPLELLQQFDNPVPIGAIWIQALIDTGRIKSALEFSDAKTVREVVQRITPENIESLFEELRKDRRPVLEELDREDAKIADLAVRVEDMWFVCADHDLAKWQKIIAHCQAQPRGFLVYDHNVVRFENWASDHIGDSIALTEEITKGIKPDPENGWIDWGKQILGEQIRPEIMAGRKKQVINEKYLSNRKSIHKDLEGNFVFS